LATEKGENDFPGFSPAKIWIRVLTISTGWMTHVARQPLIAPLAKFQKSEGVAALGGADVGTSFVSIGVSGYNTTELFKLIFNFSESVIFYSFFDSVIC
jgi:hypothetical protein